MSVEKPKLKHDSNIEFADYLVDLGTLTLSEIVGQDEAIKELKEFVELIKYKQIYSAWGVSPPKGLLLVGGPGLGKTASVRALAKELENTVVLMELRYLDIASKWVDAPLENIRSFFDIAEKYSKDKHVIIFIDEIDSMIPNRNAQLHETSMKRVNAFLEWMNGGMQDVKNITLIGSTNYEEGIDPAARRSGRFDRRIEFVDLNKEAIVKGLKIHLDLKKLNSERIGNIDWDMIKTIITDKEFTGSDLPNIIDRMIIRKASLHIDNINSEDPITIKRMFKNANLFPASINTEDIIDAINDMKNKKHGAKKNKTFGFVAE